MEIINIDAEDDIEEVPESDDDNQHPNGTTIWMFWGTIYQRYYRYTIVGHRLAEDGSHWYDLEYYDESNLEDSSNHGWYNFDVEDIQFNQE